MGYQYLTQFNASPSNYTPGPQTASVWGVQRQIQHIDIHHWDAPNAGATFEGVIAHFQNPASQVSAHYVATGNGRRVACMVSPADNAWATDQDNPYSIAIECDPSWDDATYDVVAELIADIRSAYGDSLTLHPHSEFYNTDCPGNVDLNRLDALARRKVSHDQWGQVTDLAGTPTSPAIATADEVKQAYLEILERQADADGLSHYTSNGMTIAQVRVDLQNSTEYKTLQNNKATAQAVAIAAAAAQKAAIDKTAADAKAAADAAAKAALLQVPTQITGVIPSTQKVSPMQNLVNQLESHKTILTNIAVTFVQAGGAFWLTQGMAVNKIAIAGAIGAGGSAVYNVILKPAFKAIYQKYFAK